MGDRAHVAPQQAAKVAQAPAAAAQGPVEEAREYLGPPPGLDLRHVRTDAPLIQRRCACEASGQTCQTCAVQRRAVPVSMPGDALEVDADRAADRAMRFLGGDVTARATGPIVQRASSAPNSGGGHAESTAVLAKIGSGRALDDKTRGRMETAFGSSFEGVRVHDDPSSAAMARRFDAHAFTLGQHIAFAPGAYRPGTRGGDNLLAHELAHTIQQRGAAPMLARKNAGGCAELADSVNEQKDENSRAGLIAHKQIQTRFKRSLKSEVLLPRATKDERDVYCPSSKVEYGRMDLFKPGLDRTEIGEIKSIDGEAWAKPDIDHYRKRANQLAGRLTDGRPCPKTKKPDPADVAWDKEWFNGRIAKGKRPQFVGLESVISASKETRLGPFWGNRSEKQLSCIRRDGGAVVYWCSPRKKKKKDKKKKKQQRQVQVVAVPAKKQQPKKVPIRVIQGHPAFREIYQRIGDREGPPGRDLVIAVDGDIFDQKQKQYRAEQFEQQKRRMRIDTRSVPFIAYTPWAAFGQYAAPVAYAILGVAAAAAVVVVVILLLPEVAVAGGVAATAEGAGLTAGALTTGAAATVEGAGLTTGALTTGAATTGALTTGAATTGALTTGAATTGALTTGAVATGTTFTTSTGVTLTVLEGGAAAAPAAVAPALVTGTTVAATIGKGSAAAAAAVALILATDKDANAAEILKPVVDKRIIVVKDVTGTKPNVGDAISEKGQTFKVAFVLTTRDLNP